MKTKSLLFAHVIGTLTLSLPLALHAADCKITEAGDGYRVERCGATPGTSFKVTNKRTNESIPGTVHDDGCAVTTFRNGRAAPNDNLLVEVTGLSNASCTVPGGSSNSQQKQDSPQKNSGNTQPTQQVQQGDKRKQYTPAEVRETAELAARTYANSVVNSLGKIEKIRRNVKMGFDDAASDIEAYGGNPANTRSYKSAYSTQENQGGGEYEGRNAGINRAQSDASQLASNDISSAIEKVLSASGSGIPDFTSTKRTDLSQSLNSFQGLHSPKTPPASMDERRADIDKSLQQNLKHYYLDSGSGDEEVIVLADSEFTRQFTFVDLWGQQADKSALVLSHWRGDNAFNSWKQGELRNPKDTTVSRYNNMIDSNITQNADSNVDTFARAFVSEYNNVITDKWNKMVLSEDSNIQHDARQIYMEEYGKMSADLGKYDAYESSFGKASIDGYRNALISDYNQSFASKQSQAENSSLLTDISVTIVPDQQSIGAAMGDQFTVILNSAKNMGAKDGVIQLDLVIDGRIINSLSQPMTRYSKLANAVTFSSAIKIASELQTSPDQKMSISVRYAGVEIARTNLNLTLEGLVAKLASGSDSDIQSRALTMIKSELLKEWQNSGVGNQYNNGNGDKKLERVVNTFKRLDSASQQNLRRYSNDIQSLFGKRPTGFFSTTKDDWDGAMKLMKDAGLI
jgi:hypothetical protein